MSSKEVDEWMAAYDNPQKDVVQAVREVLMGHGGLDECIKWKSPTFTYKGAGRKKDKNLASFNPRSKKHASLMFHTGAQIPGEHAILEGGGDTARYVTFESKADVKKKKKALLAVVDAWRAKEA